jgi:predicted MFS family arabinose efflux permease
VPLGGVVAGLLVPQWVAAGQALEGAFGHSFIASFMGSTGGAIGALWGLAAFCALAAAAAWPLAAALDRERDAGSPWPQASQMLAPVRFVATHPALRSVALVSFVFSMVQVSLSAYLVSLLTTDLRWTLAAAGAALAASQLAGVVGRITWGFVADRGLGARRTLLLLAWGMTGCALLMPLLGPQTPPALVLALLVVFGATAVGWNGVYLATVARLVPQAQAATATAGTLFFTFFGVVIGPPLFGAAAAGLASLTLAFAGLALPLAGGLWLLLKRQE